MMIRIDPALPCSQLVGSASEQLCGKPATQAVVTWHVDMTWELVPVCAEHLREAIEGGEDTTYRPPPAIHTYVPGLTP